MKNYKTKNRLSLLTEKLILDYYIKLYNNVERKRLYQICDDLDISDTTLKRFLRLYMNGPDMYGNYSRSTIIISCSTIFSKESPYYEYNKAFEKVIKKRELIKIVRQKANERNSKKVMHK